MNQEKLDIIEKILEETTENLVDELSIDVHELIENEARRLLELKSFKELLEMI